MTRKSKTLIALAVASILGTAVPAFAGPEINTSTGIVLADG